MSNGGNKEVNRVDIAVVILMRCCSLWISARPSGCLDMVAVEGQFTFTAERPQLSCAAFFMAEPNEVISVDYDSVDIDCRGGDFITVNCGKHVFSSIMTSFGTSGCTCCTEADLITYHLLVVKSPLHETLSYHKTLLNKA